MISRQSNCGIRHSNSYLKETYSEVLAQYWQKKSYLNTLQYLSMHLRLDDFKLVQPQRFDGGDIEQSHGCYFVALRPYFR